MSVDAAAAQCPVAHGFDLFGPEFQNGPGTSTRKAREEQPIFYSPELDCYVVTRHEDIRAVFRDTDSFSPGVATEPLTPLSDRALAKLAEYEFTKVRTLGVEEEPVHMRLRRQLDEPFARQQMVEIEPRVREIFDSYIDRFVKRGHADLVAELVAEAPAVVALEFLGVPDEDIEQTKHFAEGVIKFVFGRPTEDEQVQSCDHMGRHQQYSRALVSRLIDAPDGDGFLPHAVRVYLGGESDLDPDYLAGLAMNGLAAAHETTSNSSANALLLTLRHRDSWEAMCEDPTLIPNAVEECLRMGPPVCTWRRKCKTATTIGGVAIPEGAVMLLVLASANYDDDIFDSAETFDIHRKKARHHLTFGYGNHHCLGAPLARVQMKVLFEQLTQRLPHMRLVEGQKIEFLRTAAVGGPLSLLAEWDPAENPLPQDRP